MRNRSHSDNDYESIKEAVSDLKRKILEEQSQKSVVMSNLTAKDLEEKLDSIRSYII